VREEGGLARELEALKTGRRLGMHDPDWEGLVGLARRHGWEPSEGSEHYSLLRDGRPVVVPPSEARALAGALEEALRDLPRERRKGLRPIVGSLGGFADEPSRSGKVADYERYFSWGRRWMVEEVARLCREGAVEIRPM
jgi:hypothetical protein